MINPLYFSVVTITTLGYGDVQPTGELQLFAATQALFGFLITPILIALTVDLFRDH